MIKRISLTILSAAILVTGFIAFRNLHYWERSVMIFKLNSNQPFERGIEKGSRGFEGRERHQRPEGFREDFERGERPEFHDSIIGEYDESRKSGMVPDSLRQAGRQGDFRGERGSFRGENNFRDRRHGGYRGGNKVNLGTVGWFLAVFALFTLITTGFEKILKFIKRRKFINVGILIIKHFTTQKYRFIKNQGFPS